MQPEVMRTQAETLAEWSDEWLRLALGEDRPEAAGEVGYQLARISRLVKKIALNRPGTPALLEDEAEPPREIVAGLRDG